MSSRKLLTMVLEEVDNWAMVTCPQFSIGAFDDTKDNAKEQVYESIKVASYIVTKRKEMGKRVDERLVGYAKDINNNGAYIKDYFEELHR